MAGAGSHLEEAIEAFGFVRDGTIAEAENIPDERWDYRPHPKARSVTELVRHMIEAASMLVGEATDPEGDYLRRSPEEHVNAHGRLPDEMSPAELRAELARTHADLMARVRSAGEAFMDTPIRRFDGGTWQRLSYLHHATSHEDYHKGQLALYARMMGLIPALTQMIYGSDAS